MMNWQKTRWARIAAVLGLCMLFTSCNDQIPKRALISSGSTFTITPKCKKDTDQLSVLTTLEQGKSVNNTDGNIDTDQIFQSVDGKYYTCKTKPVTRPDNAVFWKSDLCICKDGKPISFGNCSSFCSGKNTQGAEMLYANFSVAEAISLSGLGNLANWCSKPLAGDQANPSCKLEAKDENGGVIQVAVNIAANSNSLTANVNDLALDKTYVLRVVQTSGVASNSVQIIKFSQDITLPIVGPLKQAPITQYTCLARDYSGETPEIFYENAYRMHFYFLPRLPPKPIPLSIVNLVCHDIFNPLFGKVDDELYPRLEQIPGIFNLWDLTDPRFYDNNGNGSLDINDGIVAKTKNYGGSIPASSKFFNDFLADNSDKFIPFENGTKYEKPKIGYIMSPWIDQQTYKSYCINSTHYKSSNPLFKALGDFIQVDTEGLYLGFKTAETTVDPQGNLTVGSSDVLYIRETDLKQVWFYLKNGVPTVPTDDIVANVAVYFYYPLNKTAPYVKSSTQRIYRVMGQNDMPASSSSSGSSGGSSSGSGSGSTSTGVSTTYPPHDRKIGCIPKF